MKNKILFQVASYSGEKKKLFKLFSEKTRKFAEQHSYEYIIFKGCETYRNYNWQKMMHLDKMILDKKLKDDDIVLFIDADCCIKKIDIDYPCTGNFNYSIDNGNTHCTGIWSMRICEWTRRLVKNFLDDQMYAACKDTQIWKLWSEQAAWYTMAGIPRHSWESYLDMKDFGWDKTEDVYLRKYIKYSIEELKENVTLLGPEWNTTLLEEEFDTMPKYLKEYNIVKSKKEDTIIRHFAGGQNWRTDYL